MNRMEFMRELENLLEGIPQKEREEALAYYNDYFDDAGAENEQNVIQSLGSPEKVAESIRRDMGEDASYFAEKAPEYEVVSYRENPMPIPAKKKGLPTWAIVLMVFLGIFAAPVLFGVLLGVFGSLLGVLVSAFAVFLAFGITAIVMMLLLPILLVIGFMCVPVSPWVGMACAGVGLLMGGLGLLFLMLTVAIAGIVIPAIAKGIGTLFRKLFRKKKA